MNTLKFKKYNNDYWREFDRLQLDKLQSVDDISQCMLERTKLVDKILKKIWITVDFPSDVVLLAVGGYGRREMMPYSDIDILILTAEHYFDINKNINTELGEKIKDFTCYLWNLGYTIGHAVRSLSLCQEEANKDITVATNLMEARFIVGAKNLLQHLHGLWDDATFISEEKFYYAKCEEQEKRRSRYQYALSHIEPNVKESPGGLRDIHLILWLSYRHSRITTIAKLFRSKEINEKEYEQLNKAKRFLETVRFLLHVFFNRRIDKLSLEGQLRIAAKLNYKSSGNMQAVEVFMKDYFYYARQVFLINEYFIQHFKEEHIDGWAEPVKLNNRFEIINDYLAVVSPQVFEFNPSSMFESVLLLQEYKQLKGLRAKTIRTIRNSLHYIDDDFRSDVRNKAMFTALMRSSRQVHAQLKNLHNLGILSAYLPDFNKIDNLMQFDLFHRYTVGEHTLMVIRYLRYFMNAQYKDTYSKLHHIVISLSYPSVLIIAGLFHDLAKGRGGKHEVKGERLVRRFCEIHNLSEKNTTLACWLVLNHLKMSDTAQKKNIDDLAVIAEFAELCVTETKLKYLYLLTVADIMGTNPELWNSWKDSLLWRCYVNTKKYLSNRNNNDDNVESIAQENKMQVRKMLKHSNANIDPKSYALLWQPLSETDYFKFQSPSEIARHTEMFIADKNLHVTCETSRGASELVVIHDDLPDRLAIITSTLIQLQLYITIARVYRFSSKTLTQIYFLNGNFETVAVDLAKQVSKLLAKRLLEAQRDNSKITSTLLRNKQNYFISATTRKLQIKTILSCRSYGKYTELELQTADLKGTLARLCIVFWQLKLRMHATYGGTYGETMHTSYILSDLDDKPLTNEQQELLIEEVQEAMSARWK